jgi:hypothetical protein
MARYRMVYQDGGNGFRLGEVYDLEVVDRRVLLTTEEDEEGEQVFVDRNGDGLLTEEEEGMSLLVPIGES